MLKLVEITKLREGGASILSATFMVDGDLVPLKVSSEDSAGIYAQAEAAIRSGKEQDEVTQDLYTIMSPESRVNSEIQKSKHLSDNLVIEHGAMYFNGFRLHEELADHMLSMLGSDDTPKNEKLWKSYIRFLDNLHQNVNEDIRLQLFSWIKYENENGQSFSITDDGCLVGYKGCQGTVLAPSSSFTGKAYVDGVLHEGHIPNPVGSVFTMPRSEVQFDPTVGCSVGLHVGTYDYASNWAPILLLVKVNPRDIVSVPYEVESQKMRVCEYTVLEVTEGPLKNMFYETDEDCEDEDCEDCGFTHDDCECSYEEWNSNDDEVSSEDEASLDDFKHLLTHVVDVAYDGKLFTGTVTDLYEGARPGLIVRNEDEVKHIKIDRITSANKVVSQDQCDEILEIVHMCEPGDEVYVEYDEDKDFEGVISEIYGDFDGLIIRGADEYKHIKVNRLTFIQL